MRSSSGRLEQQATIANAVKQAGGTAATGATAAATSRLSFGAQLAALAPLIGLPLGASLGGRNVGGQILGGAGGL